MVIVELQILKNWMLEDSGLERALSWLLSMKMVCVVDSLALSLVRSLGLLCHQFYLYTLDAIKGPLSSGVPTFGICDLPFPSALSLG